MAIKTALVTGASRPLGLGFAVARRLSELGHHVILTGRDLAATEHLAARLPGATAVRLDLADASSVREVADQVAGRFGHLDVLVNNAGHGPDFTTRSVLDADPDEVRTAFEVDVIGCWALIQALFPLLRQAPAARVVNVSSEAALQITAGLALDDSVRAPAHAIAKYALNALTTTLAATLSDTPILVNAVCPGATATHPERGDDDDDRSAADSATGVVWAATLDADGPTGGFFRDGRPLVPATAAT